MSTPTYLRRFLEPVIDAFTPEMARILAEMRTSKELEACVEDLAQKSNNGTISPAEQADYKATVDAADLFSILQLKARRFLKEHR